MLCTKYQDFSQSLAAKPSKTVFAVVSYCQLLNAPPCLSGMHDVTEALAALHSFCTKKVLSTSTLEHHRAVILLTTKSILVPIVDFLWCKFVIHQNGPLAHSASDFALRVHDLESHLPQSMIENIWHLYRIGVGASDFGNGSCQLEKLLTVLQKLRDLFNDIGDIMSPDGKLHASAVLKPIALPFENTFSQHVAETEAFESYSFKNVGHEIFGNNIYSLFDGNRAWPFESTHVDAIVNENTLPETRTYKSENLTPKMNTSSSYPSLSDFFSCLQEDSPLTLEQFSPARSLGDTKFSLAPGAAARAASLGSKISTGVSDDEITFDQFLSFKQKRTQHAQCEPASLVSTIKLSAFSEGKESNWQESPIRYKTAMCKRVLDSQKCRYSKACGFAHSEAEKDQYTCLHLATTRCTFGQKCHNPSCGRAHTVHEQRLAIMIYNQAVNRGRGNPLNHWDIWTSNSGDVDNEASK